MNANDKLYTSSEVSMLFNIGDSSLRRWCLELKKNGYNFAKETNKNRLFDVYDILTIIEFKIALKTKGKTQEEAGREASKMFRRDLVSFSSLGNPNGKDDENDAQLSFVVETLLKRQNEFEQRVLNEIEKISKVVNQEKIIEVTIKNKEQ